MKEVLLCRADQHAYIWQKKCHGQSAQSPGLGDRDRIVSSPSEVQKDHLSVGQTVGFVHHLI